MTEASRLPDDSSPKSEDLKRYRSFGLFFVNSSRIAKENTDRTFRLEEASIRDSQTGLYNLEAAREYATRWGEDEANANRIAALVVIDINKFKAINDKYGHKAGDQTIEGFADQLKIFTESLEHMFRKGDIIARSSEAGDEFVLHLPLRKNSHNDEDNEHIAKSIKQAIRDKLDAAFDQDAPVHLRNIDFAIGVVMHTGSEIGKEGGFDNLFHIADERMYKDKRMSRMRGILKKLFLRKGSN